MKEFLDIFLIWFFCRFQEVSLKESLYKFLETSLDKFPVVVLKKHSTKILEEILGKSVDTLDEFIEKCMKEFL